MGVRDKKFEVVISLDIKEVKKGEPCPFFDSTLRYYDMGYVDMVDIEQLMLRAVSELGAAGVQAAIDAGLGDELKVILGKAKSD